MKMNKVIKGLLFSSIALGTFIITAPNQANASHYHSRTSINRSTSWRRTRKAKKPLIKGSVKRGFHKYVSRQTSNRDVSEIKSRLYRNISKVNHVKNDTKLSRIAQNNANQMVLHRHVKIVSQYISNNRFNDSLGRGYWINNRRSSNDRNGYDIANDIINNQIKVSRFWRSNILGKNVKQIGIGVAYSRRSKTFYIDILTMMNSKHSPRNKRHTRKNQRQSSRYYQLGKHDGEAFGKANAQGPNNVTEAFYKVAGAQPLRILKNTSYQKGFRNNIMTGVEDVDPDDLPEDVNVDCPWIIPRAVAYRTHGRMFRKGMLDKVNNDKRNSFKNNKQYQSGYNWTNRWINKYVTHDGAADNLYADLL